MSLYQIYLPNPPRVDEVWGPPDTIHADFGTNYVGIKADLGEVDRLDHDQIQQVLLGLQSQGTQLIQKSPKAPWVQGSAENAVKLCKKVIPKRITCSVFQWLRLMDFTEFTLNNRPIGIQSDLEVLTPNSYKSVHFNSTPTTHPGDYTIELANAKEKYNGTILQQNKWTDTTADFALGDLVLVQT